MNTLWLKIKVWTKIVVTVLVTLFVLLFIFTNRNASVEPALNLVVVKYEHANILMVLLITAAVSIFSWWLFRTIFRTIRQLREMRHRTALNKLVRAEADRTAKASMLQTRPDSTPPGSP
ncbi:MAG: hypothetical protein IT447_02975 [Phycisphaerales bacterium]|jgi:hypothetical protein|nr:hypothetical protein [Phycisphaerales bacterium]